MSAQRRPSVLVVDDERILAQSVARLLARAGWQAEACYDGHDALERSENATFDVVVVDWGIPGLCGAELIEQLRRVRPASRLVVTSADPALPREHETVRANSIPCLPKPFSLDELLCAIRDGRS